MKIKQKMNLFFGTLVVLMSVLVVSIWSVLDMSKELTRLQNNRVSAAIIAEELRVSSENLTKMARAYIATGDIKYKKIFDQIAAIRNGEQPRPSNYNKFFWDILLYNKKTPVIEGNKQSLIEALKQTQLTPNEINILQDAKTLSDELVLIENKAFRAMEGFVIDSDGTEINLGTPQTDLATSILYGDEYHQYKNKIMTKINAFSLLLEERNYQNVKTRESIRAIFSKVTLMLSALILLVGFIGRRTFEKEINTPINYLMKWVKDLKDGNFEFSGRINRKTEFGVLANAFKKMANTVEGNLAILRDMSNTDQLTQVSNRKYLEEVLKQKMQEFDRYQTQCSVLLIDIDYFKSVNDNFGHNIGDKVIVEVVDSLINNVRNTDIVGRWGGEEFIIICPHTSIKQATFVAESLRKRIERRVFTEVGKKTVSIGISDFREELTVAEVINNADMALYQAKDNGRNQVFSAEYLCDIDNEVVHKR